MAVLYVLCDECKSKLDYHSTTSETNDSFLHVELCKVCVERIRKEREKLDKIDVDANDTATAD